jgi:hypothetical protein
MKINGLNVVDAKRPMKIKITHNDVLRGKTKAPDACAAARAWVRQGNCTEARVHLSRTYIKRGNRYERYLTPLSVRTEIVAFDRGAEFAEGEYRFMPSPTVASRSGSETGRNKPRHQKKRRKAYHVVSGVRPHAMLDTHTG